MIKIIALEKKDRPSARSSVPFAPLQPSPVDAQSVHLDRSTQANRSAKCEFSSASARAGTTCLFPACPEKIKNLRGNAKNHDF